LIRRIENDALLEIAHGLLVLPQGHVGLAAPEVRLDEVLVAPERLIRIADHLLMLA